MTSIEEKRAGVAKLVHCDILTETQAEDNEKLIRLMSRCFVCTFLLVIMRGEL